MSCPLCLKETITHYHQDKSRDYWQCQTCDLVFVKTDQLLDMRQEQAIYDLHQNCANDLGYRAFLNKLLLPLLAKLHKDARGLDFGSGPGPTISVMLQEQGLTVDNYDIYYAKNPSLLLKTYDFITCTEVVEHFYNPHQEFSLLKTMLKPNGILGIMTKRPLNQEKFKNWHYKNDPTHVCFYAISTFAYIAAQWDFTLQVVNSDTVLLLNKSKH